MRNMAKICDKCGVVHNGDCSVPSTEKEIIEHTEKLIRDVQRFQEMSKGSKLMIGGTMKTETKEQQIERLKNNWLPYCALSKEDQEFIDELRKDGYVKYLNHIGVFDSASVSHISKNNNVYRIDPDYQLPKPEIVAPEGYRIVSMEDRKRREYPTDCRVYCKCKSDTWFISGASAGWEQRYDEYVFAVPANYIFAEDRPKKKFGWVEYPIHNNNGRWHVLIDNKELVLSTVFSMVGFGGIKFEGLNYFDDVICCADEYGNPRNPVAVRFWEEVK